MVTIIKTEFIKLKRFFIIWIGISLMLLTALLTLFTTMRRMEWCGIINFFLSR